MASRVWRPLLRRGFAAASSAATLEKLAVDCPLSRPRLELIWKGGSRNSDRVPPVWLFANDIKNFQELVRLQREAICNVGTSDTRKPPPSGNLTPLIVNVVDSEDGSSQGVALFHSRPLIAARIIKGLPASRCIDTSFLREKLLAAASRRRGLLVGASSSSLSPRFQANADSSVGFNAESQPGADASAQRPARNSIPSGFYRLINGESDGLPGLVVDLFGNVVTVQQLTRGSELLTAPLLKAVRELADAEAVVLRNDSLQRQLERDASMKQYSAVVMAFSISALRGGARSSVCVDTASLSLKLAAAAAEANSVKDKVLLYQDDALRWLQSRANQQAAPPRGLLEDDSTHTGARFDLVILDPPAPHRRGLLPAFTHELRELVTAAAAITSRGGRLVVVDSSRFVHLEQLIHLISAAVSPSGKTAVLEMHGGPTLDCPQDLCTQGAVGMNWVVVQLL
ncbi:hypothetical protein ACSSS7_004370 [Eimeria intestinalis]